MKTLKILVLIYFALNNVLSQNLVINEFMSSNQNVILDQDGDSPDWIEIYNAGDEVLNLNNFKLSDDINAVDKWSFPNVDIYPSQFLLVFCSGKNVHANNELHTNFKIKQSGESLFLSNSNGVVISSTPEIYLPTNYSYGCVADGGSIMSIFEVSSPGFSNTFSDIFLNIQCSHSSGFYDNYFTLTLSSPSKDYLIYYTLDGSIPTSNDFLYTSPIFIEENQNSIHLIPTTAMEGPSQWSQFMWNPPGEINKASIIRFGAFKNDTLQTSVQSRVFFIGEKLKNHYTFPVISLITDSLNLFDYESGVYIAGKRFDEEGFNDSYWPVGNYHNRGDDWEKEIHLTYFDENMQFGFETNAGMRIRGFGSATFPQKSLNIYFKEKYGMSEINYPIFSESSKIKHKRLILRNSGNDFLYTHFRDALLQDLLKSTDLELQNFRPSIVFVNGEYWGIHNIREKYDKYYFKYKYKLNEDSVNLITLCGESTEEGSVDNYFEIDQFVQKNDLSIAENYEFLKTVIDVDNFIDFLIAEIYYANYDWPCNNYKLWKSSSPYSKWRFLIYDLDYSFGYDSKSSYETYSLEHAASLSNEWPHCTCSNLFFRKMLNNDAFKEQFINRFAFHLKNTFDPELVLKKIEYYEALFEIEIEEHVGRWGYPHSLNHWREEINILKEFAINRPCFMAENIVDFFDLESFDFDCEKENYEYYEFSAYPNPGNGKFNLMINFPVSTMDKLIVTDLTGKIVYEEVDCRLLLENEKEIDLGFLKSGIYIVNFYATNFTKHTKILMLK
tara:strand:+ start:311 stop:2656 length:2346 start_codon:yes stop_codon:yes gene_type:complete